MKLLRGFAILGLTLPAFAQYAGPAILSRGEAPVAMVEPKIDFSFSVSLTGSYTTGLAGVSAPSAQGKLADQAAFGEGITFGLSGAHTWKHTHVGINYSGSFSNYNTANYYDGISQGLAFGLSHQFSRHVQFTLSDSSGWFTQFAPATVSLNSSVPFDPSQSYIPTADFYDNRTIYETVQAGLTYQRSTRLSFSAGGAYFGSFRRSAALYGASGGSVNGDVQYRISRRTTLGGSYSFSHFGFSQNVGSSDVHGASMSLSVRFSRWTEFSLFGGGSRVESSFQQTVPLDPAILYIICPPGLVTTCPITAGTVINHQIMWGPNFGARLSRSFRRGVAFVSAGESITPGNGLFLTSRSITTSAGYGYSGLRKWSLSLGVSYLTALSLGHIDGAYGQVSGSYGMSRQLVKGLSFVSSFTATQYRSPSFVGYNRLIYSANIGLGYSSRSIPVRFF